MRMMKGDGITIGQLNLSKGILMILIILSHSILTFCAYPQIDFRAHAGLIVPGAVLLSILNGAVPLFFMICGYGMRKSPAKLYSKKQIQYFLKPYLLTAVAVAAGTILKAIPAHRSIPMSLRYQALPFLLGFCSGKREIFGMVLSTIGPVWFFLVYTMGTILLNLILKEERIWVQASVIGMMAVLGVAMGRFVLPYCIQQTLICTGYLYLGWIMKKCRFLQKEIPVYWIAGTAAFLLIFSLRGNIDISQNVWEQGARGLVITSLAGVLLMIGCSRLRYHDSPVYRGLSWIGWNAMPFCCIHTVAYLVVPWHLLLNYFSGCPLVGILVELILQFLIVLTGMFVLERFRKRKIKSVKHEEGRI